MIIRLECDSHYLTCHKKSRLLFALLRVRQAVTVHISVCVPASGKPTRVSALYSGREHSDLSPVSLHDICSTENLQRMCSNFTLHRYHVTAGNIITETPCILQGVFQIFYKFFRHFLKTGIFQSRSEKSTRVTSVSLSFATLGSTPVLEASSRISSSVFRSTGTKLFGSALTEAAALTSS